MNFNKFIKIAPVVKQALWGGDQLKDFLDLKTDLKNIAEVWVVSSDSLVLSDPFKNLTLEELYKNEKDIFGNCLETSFPILIKLIATKDKLSVQVHPDDAYAKKHKLKSGKEEVWYLVAAKQGAEIYIGHDFKSKSSFKSSIENKTIENHLISHKSKSGDIYYVSCGTAHAIGSGNLVYEVQQNSNITYRLFDYDRTDINGQKRELNIDEGLEVLNINHEQIYDIRIQKNSHFSIKELSVNHFIMNVIEVFDKYKFDLDQSFYILGLIEGTAIINNNEIKVGEHFIIPLSINHLVIIGNCTVILTRPK